MQSINNAMENLVTILQLAYSGELAAAQAYRGHWRSVREVAVRERIRKIEEEERHHRRQIAIMLKDLSREPNKVREVRAFLIGRTLQFLCHIMPGILALYAAGKLESRNIVEYETAARYAAQCNHFELVDCLLTMAEVEWEHEKFFRDSVISHRFGQRMRIWPIPPPKENIRSSFQAEFGVLR